MASNFPQVKKPVISAAAFFGTLCVFSFGYSAYSGLSTVTTGDPLTIGMWTQIKDNFDDLNSRVSNFSFSSGKIGIGTATPYAKLEVSGDVKIGNSSTACNSTTEGSARYNAATKQMEFCNGNVWKSFRPHVTTCQYNDTSNTAGWKYRTWIASDCTQGLPQSGVAYDRIANYTNTSGGGSPGNQDCSSNTQGGVYNPGVAQNYAMKCTYVEVR